MILGHPGSGKTTAILHLAKQLIDEAEDNADSPVPFLINLSKFRLSQSVSPGLLKGFVPMTRYKDPRNEIPTHDSTFENWLAAQMADFPGLSPNMAREWIQDGRVAVLLDGLDEFNDERRADLVQLLNSTFFRDYPYLVVVVCSRINEYEPLKSREETRLQLRGAVHLQDLSDEQVASYLEAAHATALLNALPQDEALRSLAKNPLTLSMLVLAYGGLAPENLHTAASLSDRRHHLFESYVARMLQRQSRREQNVPFDTFRANDVPVSKYRYKPEQVDRWLGWLALVLSVRMRTSFALQGFHNILRIGVNPERQLLNFNAIFFALSVPLSISVLLIAKLIFSLTMHGLIWGVAIPIASFFALPVIAYGFKCRRSGFRRIPYSLSVAFPFLAGFLGLATLARTLPYVLRSDISALPLTIIIGFTALLTITATEGVDREFFGTCLGWVGLIVLVCLLQLNPATWRFYFLTREWVQVTAGALEVFASAFLLLSDESLADRFMISGALTGCAGGLVAVTLVIPLRPEIAMISAAGSLVAILALNDSVNGVLCLLGFLLFGGIGAAVGHSIGLVIALAFFGFLCMIALAVKESRDVVRAVKFDLLWITWGNAVFKAVDRFVLSPCAWEFIAIANRFPSKRHKFLVFCRDAFLLKQSSQEFEFTHRLLRDYFALRELMPTVNSLDKSKRLETIRSLGYQGESALDVLADLSNHRDASVRAAALSGLSHMSSPLVAGVLMGRIHDSAVEVRQELIRCSFRIASKDTIAVLDALQPLGDACEVDPLLMGLHSGGPVHNATMRFLRRLGDPGIDRLIGRLQDVNENISVNAVKVLSELGAPQAVAPLIACLRGKSERVRHGAAASLGGLGELAAGWAVEPLIACLQDKSESVRAAAAESLGELAAGRAVEPLIACLQDKSESVRAAAAESLGKLGELATGRAVESLIACLQDKSESVRAAASESLGRLGESAAAQAIEPLIGCLQDRSKRVRAAVAKSLSGLGELAAGRAVEPLIASLLDKSERVRAAAAGSLGNLGELAAGRAVEPLIASLQDKSESVRGAAAESLGKLGELAASLAVGPLVARLQDKDEWVRASAAQSLGQLKDGKAIPPLEACLRDPREYVRHKVRVALDKLSRAKTLASHEDQV